MAVNTRQAIPDAASGRVQSPHGHSLSPALVAALRRIGRLTDDEIEIRTEARRLELNPARSEDARRLFRLASRLRAERLALLDRWLTR